MARNQNTQKTNAPAKNEDVTKNTAPQGQTAEAQGTDIKSEVAEALREVLPEVIDELKDAATGTPNEAQDSSPDDNQDGASDQGDNADGQQEPNPDERKADGTRDERHDNPGNADQPRNEDGQFVSEDDAGDQGADQQGDNTDDQQGAETSKIEEAVKETVKEEGGSDQDAEKAAEEVSEVVEPVLEKYSKVSAASGGYDKIPSGFRYSNTHLVLGPSKPQKDTSVFGRIYSMVAEAGKDGMTGTELVNKMQSMKDWDQTGAKVKYAARGVVCAAWCVGYVNGALRKSQGVLQVKEGSPVKPDGRANNGGNQTNAESKTENKGQDEKADDQKAA